MNVGGSMMSEDMQKGQRSSRVRARIENGEDFRKGALMICAWTAECELLNAFIQY